MSRIAEAFDGKTYDDTKDRSRLKAQLDDVRSIMFQSGWVTLKEISERVKERTGKDTPEASVSARLRDLRKPKFGGYIVSRRARQGHRALYEYRIGIGGDQL